MQVSTSVRARGAWVVALVVLSLGTAAASAGVETPMIVSPTAGQAVAVGSTGPLQVRWAETGDYVLRVAGPGGFSWSRAVTIDDVEEEAVSYPFTPLPRAGDYAATVETAGAVVLASVAFRAEGANVATFLAPAEGSKQMPGYTGPVRVRFDKVRWPAAAIHLRLNGGVVCSWTAASVEGKTMSCPLPALAAGGYVLEVVDAELGLPFATRSFSVLPRLLVRSRSARPAAFYPLVRDGYRDTTAFRFSLNQQAKVKIRVRNTAGKVVRSVSLGRVSSGTWRWNGRTGSGSKAKPGTYRIDLLADNGLQRKRSSAVSVRVKTALVTRRGSAGRCGLCGRVLVATKGPCYIEPGYWRDDSLYLDCWGGDYAIAAYPFTIPASTFKISFRVRGTHYYYDGNFAKVGVRVSKRRYQVRVGVAGLSSFDVERVSISYRYKKRI